MEFRAAPGTGMLRPQPTIFQSEDLKTLAVITNWGAPSATQKVIESVKDLFAAEVVDLDKTQVRNPSAKVAVELPIEFQLAEAIRSANESIYRSENENKVNTVLEVAILYQSQGVLYWARAGLPHILLGTKNEEIGRFEPLSVCAEVVVSFKEPIPLPTMGIGLDLFPNIQCGSVSVNSEMRLTLISAPAQLLPNMGQVVHSLEGISQCITSCFPQQPFWIGTAEL